MIRFDLNMEHDEVYGKFVLTVCICSILYFYKKFADCKKQTLLLFHKRYNSVVKSANNSTILCLFSEK